MAQGGTINFFVDDPTLLNQTPIAGVNGVATLTVPLSALPGGDDAFTAVYSGDNNFTASTSTALTVEVEAAATQLVLEPTASSVQAGAPDTFTLIVEDGSGNTVTGFLGSITLAGGDASAAFTDAATGLALTNDSYTFTSADAGMHTFKISDTLASSFLLTATDAADNLTPASTGLTVLAANPAIVTVQTGSQQSAKVATGFGTPLEVLVTDRYGNAVSGVTVTFQAPTSGATGVFSGLSSATAVTDANGLAVAPVFTAGAQAGGYTVTAGVAGVSASASFSLTNTAALSVASTFNTTVLQNVPSGSIKLAVFNESGGSANAADYTATVVWGDGVVESPRPTPTPP